MSDKIIKRVNFKKGTPLSEVNSISNRMDKLGKLLFSCETHMVVQFDDGEDLLAFMVATKLVSMEAVKQ